MELLTIKDVCKQLKISRWTLSKLIENGEIKTLKISGSYRFKQKDVDEFLEKSAIVASAN